ncbi:unnamed protein product, partial [Mesorhabditis belari]|uniref:Uncharacterized protein n=1 Tax=Mesorhabditis belari TaxID=2138241 RepID=A0AAF3F9F2_9BILA
EKSSKKKNVCFIATCVPNQLSHSLTANRHQLLALLKQYLPNHTAVEFHDDLRDRNGDFRIAKYVKTLDEYERLPDGDELTHDRGEQVKIDDQPVPSTDFTHG